MAAAGAAVGVAGSVVTADCYNGSQDAAAGASQDMENSGGEEDLQEDTELPSFHRNSFGLSALRSTRAGNSHRTFFQHSGEYECVDDKLCPERST